MPNEENFASTLNEIQKEQARMSEQIKGALKRIDEQKALTESVHKLATSVELLASAQKQTERKVDSLSDDVEEMKQKPAKKWDNASAVIVTAIITAILTFILSQIGLK